MEWVGISVYGVCECVCVCGMCVCGGGGLLYKGGALIRTLLYSIIQSDWYTHLHLHFLLSHSLSPPLLIAAQ